MNKILLITTKGCVGCQIMNNVLNVAINQVNIKITIKVQSENTVDREFMTSNAITDFPTTIFLVDDKIKYKFTGTIPVSVLKEKINEVFR